MSGGEDSTTGEASGYDWVREHVGLPNGTDDAVSEPVAEHV
jgi:hypothetical protein